MPRQVDHEARRTEIIHGVWALIASSGIEAVSLRRVADEAGVSVGRIQHYFGHRTELVRASARAMLTAADDRYTVVDEGGPDAALRFVVDHVIPRTESARVGTTIWLAYVAASVADPELAAILAEAKRGQEDEVVRLLGDVDRAPVAQRRSRARALIAAADGLAVRVVIGDLSAEEALDAVGRELRSPS